MLGIFAVAVQSILVYSFKEPDGSFNLEKGYAVAGMVMGVFLLTPGIFLFYTIKEPKPAAIKQNRLSILKGLKVTVTNFPFLMVVAVSRTYNEAKVLTRIVKLVCMVSFELDD